MNELRSPELESYAKNKEPQAVLNRLNKAGVDAAFDRWSAGLPHHPKAEEFARLIGELDFLFFGDGFCWKFGGDGDNGETLTYILDVIFDLQDAENNPNP